MRLVVNIAQLEIPIVNVRDIRRSVLVSGIHGLPRQVRLRPAYALGSQPIYSCCDSAFPDQVTFA